MKKYLGKIDEAVSEYIGRLVNADEKPFNCGVKSN